MKQRMALYMQDKHDMRCELAMAQYAEARGFSEIWQADTRLARDCIVIMSAFLTTITRLRLGSGVGYSEQSGHCAPAPQTQHECAQRPAVFQCTS